MRCASLFTALLVVGCSAAPADEAPKKNLPAPAAAAALRPSTDWPHFLGPTLNATSTETGILKTWPKEGLKKVWDCPLGEGYAPAAIAAGKLYHFDRVGDNNRVMCRNAETGEKVWQFEYATDYQDFYGYEPGPRAGPVVDGDRVFVYGPEGMLHALNATDGKELWKINTRSKYHVHQNFFGVGSSPLVDGNLLIVAVGGSPPGGRPADLRDAKGNGTGIVAFDKATGEQKYAVSDELSSYSAPVVAKVGDAKLGLYFARGGLLGFDPQTGKQAFHYPWRAKILESVNACNPVVLGDKILLTECYEKGAAMLKLAGGKPAEVWTDAANDRLDKSLMGHWSTPIADGGAIYGCSGRHTPEGDLRCLDAATGEVKWRERQTTRCTLLKIDGHILSLAENGELRLFKLNPAKYEPVARWEVPELEYPCWAPPAVSRGLLYVRGKGKLLCYELVPKS